MPNPSRRFALHSLPLNAPALLLAAALLLSTGCAGAGQYVADRIEREAEQRARQNTDEAIGSSADVVEGGIENAVKCAAGDDECIEGAQAEGETVVLTDADGNVHRDAQGNAVTASDASGEAIEGASANYDFQPGARTIFAEDFASDNVGDFPRRLEFVSGNMEVATWQGRPFLRATANYSFFNVPLSEELPERFTIEFEMNVGAGHYRNELFTTAHEENRDAYDGSYLFFYGNSAGLDGKGPAVQTKNSFRLRDEVVPVRVMVDGSYVKVFLGTNRVVNVPNANIRRGNALQFRLQGSQKSPTYLGNLRVAAGGRNLYSALESTGRVAVQDIQFDTGQATIKPESAAALSEIAALLTEHPDLRLLVEGHTDDAGDFDANMTLSEERAATVKDALAREHGIDAERLRTTGQGSTQPAASNDSPEGRAENRRVELVKM